jgi:hypothetical protein
MTTPSLTERALRDPEGVFETPEAVLASDQLPVEHKRAILDRWRQRIGAEASASAETGGEPNLATRLFRALSFLDTETGSHEVTHNQGFYTAIGDVGRDEPKKG